MLWSLLTCFTGIDRTVSYQAYKVMAGCFMISFIVLSFITRSNSPQRITTVGLTYILLFLTTFIYLYLTGDMYALDTTSERLEGAYMNGNDIAYELFHVVIFVFIFINFIRENIRPLIKAIIGVILVFLSLWCSILTGARQILIVVMPLAIISVWFSLKDGNKNGSPIIARTLLALFAIIAFVSLFQRYFYDIFIDSFLMTRLQDNIAEDSRVGLIRNAFDVGLENPFFGIGTGCYYLVDKSHHFSHCTYTELFANSGIIPLIAFIYMVVGFILEQRKRYRKTKDRAFLYLSICGLFWAVYNFFYAFNTAAWSMSFFFFLIGYSNNRFNTLYRVQ